MLQIDSAIPPIENLLNGGRKLIEQLQRQRTSSGERFNIFSALWLEHREIYHSRFISFLLDPRKHHDQGLAFLNPLLERIGHKPVDPIDAKRVRIIPEHVTLRGNIDIFIESPSSLIAIENKVWAWERPKQLEDYGRWLNEYKSTRLQKKATLLFLTRTGRKGASGEADSHMSYADVSVWLRDALKAVPATANSVRTVVGEYISLCDEIAAEGRYVEQISKDMFSYLTDDKNFQVALELTSQFAEAKLEIKKVFVTGVVSQLEKRLGGSAWDQTWMVDTPYSDSGNGFWNIGIRKRQQPLEPRSYECLVQNLFKGQSGDFGWFRGKRVKPLSDNTAALSARMAKDDFKPTDWWIGLQNLPSNYHLLEDDGLRRFHDDNLSSDHPLAVGLVDMLWTEFTTYRSAIELLPEFSRPPPAS